MIIRYCYAPRADCVPPCAGAAATAAVGTAAVGRQGAHRGAAGPGPDISGKSGNASIYAGVAYYYLCLVLDSLSLFWTGIAEENAGFSAIGTKISS